MGSNRPLDFSEGVNSRLQETRVRRWEIEILSQAFGGGGHAKRRWPRTETHRHGPTAQRSSEVSFVVVRVFLKVMGDQSTHGDTQDRPCPEPESTPLCFLTAGLRAIRANLAPALWSVLCFLHYS